MTITATRPTVAAEPITVPAVTTKTCARRGCDERAEDLTHIGIPLCMVHWLRARVSYNLARLALCPVQR